MTLLLGPPGSGKTTLIKALAGKSDENLKISGKVTYCGREFKEFVPQRTRAYISQHEFHYGEITVRETLDFSRRCLGVGTRYEMLVELSRREKEAGIKPDPEIDAFMKATAVSGQETCFITDYVLKGVDIKEMLAGASLMDEANRTTVPNCSHLLKQLNNGLSAIVGNAFSSSSLSSFSHSSPLYFFFLALQRMVHLFLAAQTYCYMLGCVSHTIVVYLSFGFPAYQLSLPLIHRIISVESSKLLGALLSAHVVNFLTQETE